MSELKKEYLPNYTYEEYKLWEGKWELIKGIPYSMSPSPSLEHQEVSGNIHQQLLELLKNCNNCKALLPVDWRVNKEDLNSEENILQPDNLVIFNDEKGNYITEPPALIFEILSPSSIYKDKIIKYDIYESSGVKYYIIVVIDNRIAEVYELKNGKYEKTIDAKNDTVNFVPEEGCSFDFNFSKIWIK